MNIDALVIFAAGRGTRMGDITNSTPKALINITGKPLLYYSLELSKLYNFKRIIINSHHLHEQIDEAVLAFRNLNPDFPEIIVEYEPALLETAGTVKKLAKLYSLDKPIFTLNSDIIIRPESNIFEDMIKYWNEHELDMLLLLQDTDKAYGYTGSGDFHLDELGTVTRALTTEPFPYMFAGVHLVKPEAIVENSKNVSSFREYYPGIGDLYSKVRLAGIPMQGHWYHANTPQDIVEIERAFKNGGLEKT